MSASERNFEDNLVLKQFKGFFLEFLFMMYIICFEGALKQMKIELTQKIADIYDLCDK